MNHSPNDQDTEPDVFPRNLHRRATFRSLLGTALLMGSGCGGGGGASAAGAPAAPTPVPAPPPAPAPLINRIAAVGTDRAAHLPGHAITIRVMVASADNQINDGRIDVVVRHLGVAMPVNLSAPVANASGAQATVSVTWQAPATDFQGYGLEVTLKDASGATVDFKTGAVDVSSDWRKFPRYGYLTDYSGSQDAAQFIDPLNALHINALQFYDWQWKHHRPVKGSPGNPDANWPELSNKTVQRSAVSALISAAHNRGMVALQYNLIYGAAADFVADGVDAAWGLYDQPGGNPWRFGPFPSGWTTPYLYIFNPANVSWQNYILDREMEVFQALPFDGWHADTVGDWGIKYSADGAAVDIKNTFKPFLNAARARLGSRQLVMNVVGGKGREAVNTSPIDVPYMEIWPWDGFPDYKSLKDIIETTRIETGGKSLVMPAYMNYEYGKTKTDQSPGYFNEPGVLLTEATVMAAGGSRFELGDGGRMLCHEYFPNRSLVMTDTLSAAIQRYWDFLVAYQNLLRDGQADVVRGFTSPAVTMSDNGAVNTVWAFARQGNGHEVMHFINLLGTRHNSWRDAQADQLVPTAKTNLDVKVYTPTAATQVWFASPDHEGGRAIALTATPDRDAGGAFLRVQLPVLRYWSMVWMVAS